VGRAWERGRAGRTHVQPAFLVGLWVGQLVQVHSPWHLHSCAAWHLGGGCQSSKDGKGGSGDEVVRGWTKDERSARWVAFERVALKRRGE
jgi:hypothetical protein